ncbi:MAG: hypothetical protein Q8L29_04005 [archaeon]|nr:hypothetical protein [archaeon]
MSKIKDLVGIATEIIFSELGLVTLMTTLIATIGALQLYSTCKASNPNPPIYRDVNGDGVEDKIVQKKVKNGGFLWTSYDTLKDEILYGVKVNGRKLYLPKDQFEVSRSAIEHPNESCQKTLEKN